MSRYFGDHTVPIVCPKCSCQMNEKISRLESDPDLVCGGCGRTIHVDTKELRETLATADQILDEFGESTRKLNEG